MIIDLQRRLAEIGRIRIGQQVKASNGKTRPAKLDTFRLTSADRMRIETAAHVFGGEVKQWQAPAGQQWEVVTRADAIDVVVPPSDMAFSQHYEMWSAGGCQRRCDGREESISGGACVCDPDRRECDIHTRLSVMLRDLPGLGVWRIDTSGYYAAVELEGAVHVIQMAAGQGRMLPARLRLEQRMVKRIINGKSETRRFAVPVLDVEVSPGELMGGRPAAAQIGPAGVQQIDGSASLTPVPALTESGGPSVADQAAAVDEIGERPRRANAAAPMPATGLKPRTAAQAAADEAAVEGITSSQLKNIGRLMSAQELTDRAVALAYVAKVIGREIKTRNDLTKAEASKVIDALEADAKALLAPPEDAPAPPADDVPPY